MISPSCHGSMNTKHPTKHNRRVPKIALEIIRSICMEQQVNDHWPLAIRPRVGCGRGWPVPGRKTFHPAEPKMRRKLTLGGWAALFNWGESADFPNYLIPLVSGVEERVFGRNFITISNGNGMAEAAADDIGKESVAS
ncbi:hypothetical protein AVEN_269467-1 [Araneus ventricosus]|uniref:Uncharacterized protein n=1 Tax=Araneus ventricosus TaxID=182803 RepID=A0A4Y2TMS4_ARAVE|nr:hypothetical protein AVEN_269467-1 [Araneus ventricosus]